MASTNKFHSDNTGRSYNIRHQMNCQSKYVIYLGSCALCKKKQYVGKSETSVNIRINNHRQDTKKTKSIPFDSHFNLPNHNFNKHARFTLIEQVRATNLRKEVITKLLERREDFWMTELQTIQPRGLNVQLNSGPRNQIREICS